MESSLKRQQELLAKLKAGIDPSPFVDAKGQPLTGTARAVAEIGWQMQNHGYQKPTIKSVEADIANIKARIAAGDCDQRVVVTVATEPKLPAQLPPVTPFRIPKRQNQRQQLIVGVAVLVGCVLLGLALR